MASLNERLSTAVTVALALSAMCVAGAFVYDVSANRAAPVPALTNAHIPDWRELASVGHRVGPTEARVTLIEFSDFECPACRSFATNTLPSLEAQFAGRLAVVHRNWPLTQHVNARLAATTALCAEEQGRFQEMRGLLFRYARVLDFMGPMALADSVQMPSPADFESCLGSARIADRIDRDIATAKQIGGTGTPIIILNDTMFGGVPSAEELSHRIQGLLRE